MFALEYVEVEFFLDNRPVQFTPSHFIYSRACLEEGVMARGGSLSTYNTGSTKLRAYERTFLVFSLFPVGKKALCNL